MERRQPPPSGGAFALLIGGAPGAGKTTLARSLGGILHVDSLSGDDLVHAAKSVTIPESHGDLHVISAVGHVEYFTNTSPAQVEQDMSAFIDAAGVPVRRVIESRLHTGESVVIDYWAATPKQIQAYGFPRLLSVWLDVDPAELLRRERKNAGFVSASANPDRMFETFMHRSLWHQDRVVAQAHELGLPVIRQPGNRSVEDLAHEVCEVTGL